MTLSTRACQDIGRATATEALAFTRRATGVSRNQLTLVKRCRTATRASVPARHRFRLANILNTPSAGSATMRHKAKRLCVLTILSIRRRLHVIARNGLTAGTTFAHDNLIRSIRNILGLMVDESTGTAAATTRKTGTTAAATAHEQYVNKRTAGHRKGSIALEGIDDGRDIVIVRHVRPFSGNRPLIRQLTAITHDHRAASAVSTRTEFLTAESAATAATTAKPVGSIDPRPGIPP